MADSTHPHPSRPPLLRGNTVPLYVRTVSTPVGHDQARSQAELAAAANGPLSARADGFRGYGTSSHHAHMSNVDAEHRGL